LIFVYGRLGNQASEFDSTGTGIELRAQGLQMKMEGVLVLRGHQMLERCANEMSDCGVEESCRGEVGFQNPAFHGEG
jgi:hypothetical protein